MHFANVSRIRAVPSLLRPTTWQCAIAPCIVHRAPRTAHRALCIVHRATRNAGACPAPLAPWQVRHGACRGVTRLPLTTAEILVQVNILGGKPGGGCDLRTSMPEGCLDAVGT